MKVPYCSKKVQHMFKKYMYLVVISRNGQLLCVVDVNIHIMDVYISHFLCNFFKSIISKIRTCISFFLKGLNINIIWLLTICFTLNKNRIDFCVLYKTETEKNVSSF